MYGILVMKVLFLYPQIWGFVLIPPSVMGAGIFRRSFIWVERQERKNFSELGYFDRPGYSRMVRIPPVDYFAENDSGAPDRPFVDRPCLRHRVDGGFGVRYYRYRDGRSNDRISPLPDALLSLLFRAKVGAHG